MSGMKQARTVMIGTILDPPPVVGRESESTFTKRQLFPDESMSCDTQFTHTRLIHRRRSVLTIVLLDRRFHTRGGDPLGNKQPQGHDGDTFRKTMSPVYRGMTEGPRHAGKDIIKL